MGFQLVLTWVILNDLERHNSLYFVFFSPNSIALQANYVTVVEDRPMMSAKYRIPVPFFHFWPKQTHSAIAEHLVVILLFVYDAV